MDTEDSKRILSLAALAVCTAAGLAWLGIKSYPIFHFAIELAATAVCISVFTIGWNTRHIASQDHFTVMGCGYLGCAVLEFFHVLGQAHPFGFFADPNVSLNFWLAARTVLAAAFLHSVYAREGRMKVNHEVTLAAYGMAAVAAAALIICASNEYGRFIPALKRPWHLAWRWGVNVVLLAGFWRLLRLPGLHPENRVLLMTIAIAEIAGQIAFTLRPSEIGVASVVGHILKVVTRLSVYSLLVMRALQDPYHTLFSDLTEAVNLMRAQRHDMINDLTLTSTYLQMDRVDEARQCIEVIAAGLSDRYNYMTLPKDAWYQVITAKSALARERGIRFECRLEAPMPDDFDQRRLLPKLVGNILDNAIDAAASAADPWISLEWRRVPEGTVLRITNNGEQIPSHVQARIFEPGSSTKGSNRGFGLTICRKIANELGAALTVESSADRTTFALTLPDALPKRDGAWGSSVDQSRSASSRSLT